MYDYRNAMADDIKNAIEDNAEFWGLAEMTAEQKKICDESMFADDIPDELIFELYDGISFVKEDFWVNVTT